MDINKLTEKERNLVLEILELSEDKKEIIKNELQEKRKRYENRMDSMMDPYYPYP